MKVIITHYSDVLGLTATLIMLQTQLEPPEEIIVVDTSPTKTGLEVTKRYNYNIIPVKVVCERVQIYKAWNAGIEVAGNSDILIINDDLVIPIDLIKRLQFVMESSHAYCVVPQTVGREFSCPEINLEYKPFCEEMPSPIHFDWMPGFCFALSKECIKEVGLFDTDFNIWFGDTDYEKRIIETAKEKRKPAILKERKAFVYHFGGKSQKYKSEQTLDQIAKDREYFYVKYPYDRV